MQSEISSRTINNARPNLQMHFTGGGTVLPSVLLRVWGHEERLRLNLKLEKKAQHHLHNENAMISNFHLLHTTGEAGGEHWY